MPACSTESGQKTWLRRFLAFGSIEVSLAMGKFRLHDSFSRRARQQGYRSRAAYKLLELERRYRLLRAGDAVVDLGSWPGGWLQVVAEAIGPRGVAVGVDRVAAAPLPWPNVHTVEGDIADGAIFEQVRERLGRPADVVLCDAAPRLSGVRPADEARTAAVWQAALAWADRLLRPGGRAVVKVFTSSELPGFVAEFRRRFEGVRRTRPEATRRGSAEMYLIGLGHRRRAARRTDAPAWRWRLSAAELRDYERSDAVATVRLRPSQLLREEVLTLAAALRHGDRGRVESAAQRLVDEVCALLRMRPLRVAVRGTRPTGRFGELHGLYTPGDHASRDRIEVWMYTAQRRQVVAFRTFVRTILHEVCHHLDYERLHLSHSFHTLGFFRRESSLYRAVTAGVSLARRSGPAARPRLPFPQ